MPKIQSFTVISTLPDSLKPLRDLASNMWWTWNHGAREIFQRLARDRGPNSSINPMELVNSLSSEEIRSLESDSGFLAQLEDVTKSFQQYKADRTWWLENTGVDREQAIAYFSLEFALHESLTIYSGGLGVLAGDHLKASSDLGVPLVGVGLLYYEGYFSQYLNADGWQQESYPQINLNRLPFTPALCPDGTQAETTVKIKGESVRIIAWKLQIGSIELILLDTNVEQNKAQHRAITARLYGGDLHVRIQQEIVLGIGGLRILGKLGIEPYMFHMNEGHSACISLEQMRQLMERKELTFDEALRGVRATNLFTTHTPVPAGNDVFPRALIEEYFREYAKELGISIDKLLKLGQVDPENADEPFSMPALALRTSASANGVSELHGHVSRKMWHEMWPDLPAEENPIKSITNGVHTATWASRDTADLFDRYLGPKWREETASPESWSAVSQIPDEELWRLRTRSRSQLISFCRERVKAQLMRRGAGRVELEHAKNLLNPDALTIGFARRFATYKRATLVLHDFERLCRLVSDTNCPVQFIFAGKAHPADQHGKELIARLVHAEHTPALRGKFVFIEDYDVHVGAHMVQGVDVWLNTPRRPLEASGTSGMKVAINGGLNFSVLDGWWCEAFDGANGWSIGQGEEYEDAHYHDQVESRSLYDLLEREIIPSFYVRNAGGIPSDWVRLIRHSIRTITPKFSANRMVADYATKFYGPKCQVHKNIVESDFDRVRQETKQIAHLRAHWKKLQVVDVETEEMDHLPIGEKLPIKVRVKLGDLSPEQVVVEIRHGALDATKKIRHAEVQQLSEYTSNGEAGSFEFNGVIPTNQAGTFGFEIRLLPRIGGVPETDIPGLITWWT